MRTIPALPALLLAACAHADGDTPIADATVAEALETTQDPTPATDWLIDDIAHMAAEGGKWVASNEAYMTENEPFEAYAMEWKAGLSPATMTGRLYGVKDGEPTGDFWRFRQYWHPGKAKAVLEQFGAGGAVGVGTSWPIEGGFESIQTFYRGGAPARETGHRSNNPDEDIHITESFNIVDGEWKSNRIYMWKRVSD
ncbi:MAG: hypothetical protein HKN14_06310 [Marinicaulis sp.]|nr:hypothetical protein [Marinicaulis sp.]